MNISFQQHELIFLMIFSSWLFWMWMLLECVVKEQLTREDKLGWTILIASTYLIGAMLYFLIRRPKRIALVGE